MEWPAFSHPLRRVVVSRRDLQVVQTLTFRRYTEPIDADSLDDPGPAVRRDRTVSGSILPARTPRPIDSFIALSRRRVQLMITKPCRSANLERCHGAR